MAENLISSPAYRVAFSMYVALGGDPNMTFDSVDAIYAAIDELYGKGTRVTIENLSVEITENGGYLYDNEEITGYKPVSVNVSVPQKYTDEQVESLKETARQEGYDSGYELGVSDGFTQGESEGYNDGYVEGLEDGAADQKELLEAVTFTENGTYTKEDGYNEVTVAVEMPDIPTFETEELSVELTENGTYNYTPTTDGYSKVDVTVNVGGVASKPKIYNGFRFTGGDISTVDFSQYDWSDVYDGYGFFSNCKNTTDDWSNFINNFNGKFLSCKELFYRNTSATQDTFTSIPNLNKFTDGCISLYSTFAYQGSLTDVSALQYWKTNNVVETISMFHSCYNLTTVPLFDTSNVITMQQMFYGCSKLTTVPLFDTSNVVDMGNMFQNCIVLTDVPLFDTSNATKLNNMFQNCKALTTVPQFDTSNAGNISYMFSYCEHLISVPELNCGNVSDVNNMFYNCPVTDLGGFKDLGANTGLTGTNSNFLQYAPYLTHESIMNVINKLYDRASAGYSVLTLKLHANVLALLTDEEKAIATSKGWTIA